MPRRINLIVIHCSDSTFGDAALIDNWHRERGWDCIGYHYVICRDGKIEEGRELERIGAHVKGKNRNSIGICLIGIDEFTEAQMTSLFNLLCHLTKMYPTVIINGHYELDDKKTCPNIDMSKLRKRFAKFKPVRPKTSLT